MDRNYLSKFREKAFKGAFSLFKRVLIPNMILNIVMSIIFLAIFIPLILSSFGWSAEHISEFNEKLVGEGKSGGIIDKPKVVFGNLFVDFVFGFFILALLVGLIMFSWMYFTYLKLNDNEIREKNNGILFVLSNSFSSRIWTIIACLVIFIMVSFVLYLIYFELIAMIFPASRFWGIAIGFLGFFVMMLFFMRFIMVIPAIVHGDKSIIGAMQFSYRHMTWKRSGILLLLGLVILAALAVIMLLIFYLVSFTLISGDGENSILSFIIFQVAFAITGAAIGAFIYSSLSALYFRYSEEEDGEPVSGEK